MNKKILYILAVFVSLLFVSCNPTKHVPQNQYLLNKVKIKSDIKDQPESELHQYLRQTPNSRSFGLFRMRLGIYNISGRDSTKGFNRFFRRVGDPPVIYDEYMTQRSSQELQKYLKNKGYINVDINYNTKFKKKKANVEYTVKGNEPYRLGDFNYAIRNDTIADIIKKDSANSLIHENMLFDVDIMDQEMQRITNLLKEEGYYNFNKSYLHYLADSTGHDNKINVRMILRPATRTENDGNVIRIPQKQYTVRQIKFFTSYDPIATTNISSLDSIVSGEYVVYFENKPDLRPDVLIENCHIELDKLYNEQQVEKTYSALSLLSAVKYVNIRFREVGDNLDSLDCVIFTSPSKKQSYSIDAEGTNSSGDFGFAGILGYQHKNLFRGSEFFRISLRLAHETQTGSISDLLSYSSNEIGGEASLTFPKFLFPFLKYDFRKKIRASTEFNASYNLQKRPEYTRTIASAGTKYHWFQNKSVRHSVDLIDLSYVYLPEDGISQEFKDKYLNNNSILSYSFQNQLIMSAGYSLNYGNQSLKKQRDNVTFRFGVESAGNLLYGIANLFNFEKVDSVYAVGKIKFAQYIKTDFDFSYDQYLDHRNNLVYHFGFGIGIPYGNASALPFEKRYIAGGANSVRGWPVRTLGPGLYTRTDGSIDYMNQSGDIKLDLNVEYRFKMFWLMEGALFADAGNIWTLNDDLPEGQFKFNQFYKQLALGYGIGLRFDFTYFLIRIDMGFKAYNPVLEGSKKWRFKGFGRDDYAFHFAVGYPF